MPHLEDEGVDANKGGRGVGVRERLIRTSRGLHKVQNPTTKNQEPRTKKSKNQVGQEPVKKNT